MGLFPKAALSALLVLSSSLLFFSSVASAAETVAAELDEDAAKRVVLVVIGGLSLGDVAEHPRWQTLASKGWLAGMTLKTARGHGDVHQMVTLGAGVYAAGEKGVFGYDADEWIEEEGVSAADWYAQLTGRRRTEGVLVPSIGRLKKVNEKTNQFPAAPGALGRLLREAGGLAAVFGNSDRGSQVKRLAPLLTMDETGWTPVGEVGKAMLRPAPDRPFGVAAHYEKMLAAYRHLPPDVRLVVFELGDLDRLEAVRERMEEPYARQLRQRVLHEMAEFVEKLLRSLRSRDALMVVSPMVDADSYRQGMWLAPVLWLTESSVAGASGGGGLLYSDSTRRAGIVTNLDVTATILAELDIPRPAGMGGFPLRASELAEPPGDAFGQGRFWHELALVQWAHRLRPEVLRPYVVLQITLLLLAAVVWGFRFRRWYRPIRLFLLALLFAPTVLLFVSAPRAAAGHVLLLIWGVPVVMAWLTERVSVRFALLTAAASIWLAVAVDLIRGGVWLKRSLLGYDPMLAARFYGIGNEYMGVVIGAVILTAALVWEWSGKARRRWVFRFVQWAVPAGMLAWLIVLAAPMAGANAGGAVAAGVGFAGTWALLRYPGLSPGRLALSWLIGLGLALLSLVVLNGWWFGDSDVAGAPGGTSHVGKALTAAEDGQWEMLRAMAFRKVETNWRLIRHSIWTKVFATALVVSFIVQFFPPREIPGQGSLKATPHPAWTAAFRGILAASVAALLFNDSGIVAAATAIVYLVVPKLVLE